MSDVRDAGTNAAIHAFDARRWPCDDSDLLPTLCGIEEDRELVHRQPDPTRGDFCPDCRDVLNAASR